MGNSIRGSLVIVIEQTTKNHLSPPMPDAAKTVTLLISLSFELDDIASRLCESVPASSKASGVLLA